MEKIKRYLKEWKWYELLFLFIALTTLITLSILFNSNIIDLLTSILTIIMCLLLTKGKFTGHIVGIIATILYVISSTFVGYYGEVIISIVLMLPMGVWALISWLKNRRNDKEQGKVVIIKKVKTIELIILFLSQIIMFIGYYFLLKAFNTQFLIMSTLSVSVSFIGTYLLIRRSDLNWLIWIFNSFIIISLWLYMTVIDLSYITLTVMSFFLLINNIYGYINWQVLKKRQNFSVNKS